MRRPAVAAMGVIVLLALPVACARSSDGQATTAALPVAPPQARDAASESATGPCRPPSAHEEPPALDGAPLVVLCHGVYIDPSSSAQDRDSIKRWYGEALAGLAGFLGPAKVEPPAVVVCSTDPCVLRFAGPTRRSRAIMEPRPVVVITGIGKLTMGTILHEMVHVAIFRRMGAHRRDLPAWFDEGTASLIGDNAQCSPGYKRPIDDLRRLRANYAWENFTNVAGKMEPAYCQAHDEIAAWVERRGRSALVDVIDAVVAGRSFDDVYGPLVTALPPGDTDRSLDGKFALDENSDTNGVDSSGRPHLASLMGGASWTTGHHGSGVKVVSGAYVRADDFFEYGLPDKPFSISLWEKPLTNAHVLIHTAINTSGGQGWCIPLLGHDTSGHLVAQVPFASDPKAFLSATGPVLALNKWSHVAITWSAPDGVRLYVNGVVVASGAPQSQAERHRDAPAMPMRLFFGSDNEARCWTQSIEPGHWNGVVDELHVYNYALSSDEVLADMRKP